MARTKVTRTELLPTAFVPVTFTAADTTNKNYCDMSGLEVLLVQNTAGSGGTYTVESTPDPAGRTDDITTEAVVAAAIHAVGPFKSLRGWSRGSALNVEGSATTMLFAWLRIPMAG